LNAEELAGMIDHTFLRPFRLPGDIERHCEEAARYRFAIVAIHPAEVETCVRLLRGTGVGTGAAVGFPLGQNTVETKAFETADALDRGAAEIDTVINIRALQAGCTELVRMEIANMVRLCREHRAISKVILETCYLSQSEKVTVCRLACAEGADFVKTSTGFGPAGAQIEDVALLRRSVGPNVGVKAAGGVRNLKAALAMLGAGATRIGTSRGVEIMRELEHIGVMA
jgi:deoxyribose-phosphate aldolase